MAKVTPKESNRQMVGVFAKLKFSLRKAYELDADDTWISASGLVEVDVSAGDRWTILYEEVRKNGNGPASLIRALKDFPIQKKRTNEMTGTGGIEGFGTPYAFAGNDEDKKKINEAFERLMVEARGETPRQYVRFLTKHGFRVVKANVEASTSSSHIVGDLWTQEPTNIEVIVSRLGKWKVSYHRETKWGGGLENLTSALSKYVSIRDNVNEGTRLTSNEIEKMLKQAGWENLGAGAGSADEWEKPYKTGTKTIFVSLAGWNVNGGPQGHHPWELKRYLTSPNRVNEAGDPYYGWRNDETKTPRQKIGGAISEIHKQLREVERVVRRTQRLKKETGTSNGALWNRTNKAMMKIESRMHRISQTIRNMRG